MSTNKFFCISIFLSVIIFFANILIGTVPAEAGVLEALQNDLCPGATVQMVPILKKDTKFVWKDRSKPLVFPAGRYTRYANSFPPTNSAWTDEARAYAFKSLRLIPPKVLNEHENLLTKYYDASNALANEEKSKTVNPEIVARVFRTMAKCCMPTVKPENIPLSLDELMFILDKNNGRSEQPEDGDLQ
jgi:hypothetical protein